MGDALLKVGRSDIERMNLQHSVLVSRIPELVLAPIDLSRPGLRILDQATGGGAWLEDINTLTHGRHTYVGTDIEPSYFPTNFQKFTSYHCQSITDPWPATWNRSFDLVHSRLALANTGTSSLSSAVKNLANLVKPGGYVQFVEFEFDDWNVGPAGQSFHDTMKRLTLAKSYGQAVNLREKLIQILYDAGLENVDFDIVDVPVGKRASPHMRELSVMSLCAMAREACEDGAGKSASDDSLKDLERECLEVGCEWKVFVLWGRRPEAF